MKFLQRNLMARLMTYFVLLAMLSLVIGITGYEIVRRSIIGEVEAHLDSVATLKEEEIENWVEHLEEYLVWLSTDHQIHSHASTLVTQATVTPQYLTAHESLATEFRRAVALGEVSLVFLLDGASGQVVASSNPTWEGIFRGNEQYFVEGKSRTYVSDIFYSLKLDQSTMVISTPVKDSTGQLLAVLVAHASMEWLIDIMLERTGLGETGETYLVNKSNLLLTESRFIPEAALEHWVFTEGVNRALKGEHGTSFYPDYRGVPVIGDYRWVENMEVALLTEIDQAEAFAPIKDLRNIITGTAGGVMVIIALLYLLLSRSVSQPIKRLVSATRTIAQGNLDYRVGAIAHDEIGELAGAFDQMTENLSKITASRDELNREMSERKQAQEEIEKFKAIVEGANYGIAWIDSKEGKLIYANEAFDKMHGYAPGQLTGRHYSTMFSEEQLKDIDRFRKQLLSTGKSITIEVWRKKKDGTIFPSITKNIVIKGSKGEPLYIAASVIDITERREAEEEIQRNRDYLKRLNDSLAEVIINVKFPERTIEYVNQAMETVFGYTPEECIGRTTEFLFANREEYQNTGNEVRDSYNRDMKVRKRENRYMRKNGEIFPAEVTSSFISEDGKMTGNIAVIRDITERKKAEEEIVKFKTISDRAGYGATIASLEGQLIYVNDSFARMHDYEVKDLIGKPWQILYPEDQAAAIQALRVQLMEKGGSWVRETWRRKKDGTVFPSLTTGMVINDDKGKPLYIAATAIDITEHKKAEEEIRKFKTIADIAGYGVAMTNPERKITYVNEYFSRMHGYRIDELIGKHISITYPDEEQEHVKGLIRKMTQASGYENEEVWHKKKDGTVFPTLMTGITAMDDKGKPILLTAITIDITERKKMEEQLRHSQVLASLGEMTAGISHEVNNPLASIILLSEVVLAGDMPKQTRRDIKVIQGEAKRAANIMRDLLTYSRRVQPRVRRIDLHSLIKKVLDMRRYQETVRNITLTSNLLKGPLYVNGDSSQLTQVIINLVMNAEEALKESKKGSIVVTTRIDGERVKLSVADNGTGIPEENLNQIFNPFFTTKEVGKGTGLGLSTCYGIVTSHGGLIHAENNEKGGATFTVELPLAGKGRQGILSLRPEEVAA